MVPLGVDDKKLGVQLAKLDEVLHAINAAPGFDAAALENDSTLCSATERWIQVAVECCLNIGNHVIAGLSLQPADSYRGVFIRLGQQGIVPQDVADRMAEAAQFRNRLIHLYWDVSPQEIAAFCQQRLDVVREFAPAVVSWLREQGHLA